jgi:hypothetical protein
MFGVRIMVVLAVSVCSGLAQTHFPAELPSIAAGETSEIKFYPHPTQIGTVALRTIRDRTGRVDREIYYTSSAVNWAEPRENDLRVQSIKVYFNDTKGRVDRIEHWQTGSRAPKVERNQYSETGQLTRTWYVETDGVRRYEIRFEELKSVTHLYYDDTGTYLTSLRGRLVSDVDLPHGWGVVNGGLACGITLSTERGRFDDVGVWVNVQNVSTQSVSISNLAAPSFEVRDAQGNIVTPRATAATTQQNVHQLYGQLLDHQEAGFMYPAYRLADYFEPLAPGKYSIRIRQPLPERNVELISNDVTFVVNK